MEWLEQNLRLMILGRIGTWGVSLRTTTFLDSQREWGFVVGMRGGHDAERFDPSDEVALLNRVKSQSSEFTLTRLSTSTNKTVLSHGFCHISIDYPEQIFTTQIFRTVDGQTIVSSSVYVNPQDERPQVEGQTYKVGPRAAVEFLGIDDILTWRQNDPKRNGELVDEGDLQATRNRPRGMAIFADSPPPALCTGM